MTDIQTCPECGARMRFSRVKHRESVVEKGVSFIDKRRDCKCGYADRVLLRQEVAEIVKVAKKIPVVGVRPRSPAPSPSKKRR